MPSFLPVLPKVPQTHRFQSPWPRRSRIFRTFPGLPDVLVTGASGAIGSDLAPRLLRAGHRVRGFARDPARVTVPGLEGVVRGDAVTGDGLDEALAGVDVAYYLIHSMESAAQADGPFADRERRSADNFARAAARAGVRRIVYLGGLVPPEAPLSPHLASRLEVEDLLLAAAPEAVALRASIVIGARSRSFRFLVRLVERVPVMPLPDWRENRTAPIDGRDVMAYLVAAGTSDAVAGPLSLDVGGPEVMTYGTMIERIRDALLLGRPRLDLPLRLTAVASRIAAAIAGEDPALIEPLMGSLGSDLLARDERARELFAVRLHAFDAAVEHALGEWEAVEELAGR
jgi:uncharacterized protein YbjT (DUF2867 family)